MIDLAPPERVAEQLGVCVRTVQRRADEGALPSIRLGRLLRISPEPLPASAAALIGLLERSHYTAAELAQAWGVHAATLHRLARRQEIPLALRQGQWVISRRALATWLARSLSGDRRV